MKEWCSCYSIGLPLAGQYVGVLFPLLLPWIPRVLPLPAVSPSPSLGARLCVTYLGAGLTPRSRGACALVKASGERKVFLSVGNCGALIYRRRLPSRGEKLPLLPQKTMRDPRMSFPFRVPPRKHLLDQHLPQSSDQPKETQRSSGLVFIARGSHRCLCKDDAHLMFVTAQSSGPRLGPHGDHRGSRLCPPPFPFPCPGTVSLRPEIPAETAAPNTPVRK